MYNYLYLEIIYWECAIHVVYTVEPLKSKHPWNHFRCTLYGGVLIAGVS